MRRLDEILKRGAISPDAGATSPTGDAPPSVEDAPEAPPCPHCGGFGFVRRPLPLGHPQFGRARPCDCVLAETAEERQTRLLRYSNLGLLRRLTFDTLMPRGRSAEPLHQERFALALDAARRYAEQPEGWLALLGRSGAGKTHLAAAIANHRIALGRPALFIVVPDLLDHLRASYRPDAVETYDSLFEQVRNAPLLILDDLGAQSPTPWAGEKLYQIVNHRYNAQLPTVVTAALALDDLDERLRTRLGDISQSQVFVLEETAPRTTPIAGALSLPLVRGMTFASFHPGGMGASPAAAANLARALDYARSYAEGPDGWLVFMGGTGSGKTHLAAAIGHRLQERGCQVEFVVVPDLLDRIRALMSDDGDADQHRLLDHVRTCPYLILDDLGVHSATRWAQEKLFQILNHRYNARLSTVITIGRPLSELPDAWVSRMYDTKVGFVFEIEAPDYRGAPRPDTPPRRRR
jgi:DNA replication protein DnaC